MSEENDSGCESSGNVLGCQLPATFIVREPGWEWRCNADGEKLRAIVDSYRELGFEVRLERLNLNALSENCAGCKSSLAQASAVFVKKKKKLS